MLEDVLSYIDKNQDAHRALLFELLRIPSISTDPQRKNDVQRGAQWMHKFFTDCGFDSSIVETAGHPCVLADSGADSGAEASARPTLLVYGHYDVQPTGDESLWRSPAFEPTIRDGSMYGRGVADDKGQMLTHLLAAAAWKKVAGRLPVRVKFVIEGEEEIGSPNMEGLLAAHQDRLACNYVALSDTPKFDQTTPAITYGTKGMVYKEIIINGPKQNLHSGAYGGTVTNPGNALAKIVASLRDDRNKITIPGFYDDVREVSNLERRRMEELPFDEEAFRNAIGVSSLEGEDGFSTLHRKWARPTLDVNGLLGGFTGEGTSTVIPAKVMAKVSMRIVPDQHPDKVSELFDRAVRQACPPGVDLDIRTLAVCEVYIGALDSPAMRAAEAAIEDGFGKRPVFIREGGSLPILAMFKRLLGADSLMLGFCTPDCNAHGPNEFLRVDDFQAGTRTAACFLDRLAKEAR